MAKADRKHHGPAVQGKGDGTGAMTDFDEAQIPANAVLSNRDKSRHSDDRGLDGKAVLTAQMQDHAAARAEDNGPAAEDVPLDREDLEAAQLDNTGEGAHARLGDIVEDKE